MKPIVLVLAGLLAAHAALFVLGSRREISPHAASAGSASGAANGAATSVGTAADAARRAAQAEATEAAALARAWTSLQKGDLKNVVARLQAAGFPPKIVRAIIQTLVAEQFAARRKELAASLAERPFWTTGRAVNYDPRLNAAQRELWNQQNDLVKSLLGPDPDQDPLTQASTRRLYGDLPREKGDAVQRIVSDYSELRGEVYANSNGVFLPEDREKLAFIEKEQRADLAQLLTPQELAEYELRSSNTASSLRSQLATFKPSEAEFRALFEAARQIDEKYGSNLTIGGTPDSYRERAAAVNAQAKLVLSPERLAEFEQATDPQFSMANRLVARLDLPPTAARDVVAVQQDIQKRAAAVRNTRDLPATERAAQLAALKQEATTRLGTTLGTRGLEAYKGYGGQWIDNLTPPAAPGPRPGTTPPTTTSPAAPKSGG